MSQPSLGFSRKVILWNHSPQALGVHIMASGIILTVQELALTKPQLLPSCCQGGCPKEHIVLTLCLQD